jgi:hypothetical protein
MIRRPTLTPCEHVDAPLFALARAHPEASSVDFPQPKQSKTDK